MFSVRRAIWTILLAVAAALLGPAVTAEAGERHPQDGPHIDLRFELRADALVADLSMNLVFLDEILPPRREQSDRIELSELRASEPDLLARLAETCVVTVDGRRIAPRIEGLAMNEPDESLLPLFPISGMRGLRKVRCELVHPLPPGAPAPSTVSLVWHAYPFDLLAVGEPKPRLVIAAELVADGIRSQLTFTESEPECVWHAVRGGIEGRLLAVPRPASRSGPLGPLAWAALGAGGAAGLALVLRRRRTALVAALAAALLGTSAVLRAAPPSELPSDDEAKAIFDALHANLYKAFDYAEESAVYDALERSVDGPLLEDLYLTIHRSLVMQEEGGAVSRVREVRRGEIAIESIGMVPASTGHGRTDAAPTGDVASFLVRCRYQVDGRVTHWGHAHDRTYEYLARYTVVARPKGWRIAEAEVLEQTRVDQPTAAPAPAPNGRKDDLLDL